MRRKNLFRTWLDDTLDVVTMFVSLFAILYVSVFFAQAYIDVFAGGNGYQYLDLPTFYEIVPGLAAIATFLSVTIRITTTLIDVLKKKYQNKLMKLYAESVDSAIYPQLFSSYEEEKKEKALKNAIEGLMFFNTIVPFLMVLVFCFIMGQNTGRNLDWSTFGVTSTVMMLIFAIARYKHMPRSIKEWTELCAVALWRY